MKGELRKIDVFWGRIFFMLQTSVHEEALIALHSWTHGCLCNEQ